MFFLIRETLTFYKVCTLGSCVAMLFTLRVRPYADDTVLFLCKTGLSRLLVNASRGLSVYPFRIQADHRFLLVASESSSLVMLPYRKPWSLVPAGFVFW